MDNGISNFILYTAPSGEIRIEVYLEGDTLWLTQKTMGELFGVVKSTISEHLTNIFKEKELTENAVVRNFRTTAADGKMYNTNFYNLDAIISVGYRVNSSKATQFRIWATNTLKEYIIKGFVLDDTRLKQGQTVFGKDYFKELLQRVRSIRASERRVYQQVTEIFAECSIDYDKNADTTKQFYATVQNKFHFAITGKTAAEIIFKTADTS
ncbi:MAG: virulence RhuM family protein, partial [Ferruginibacter sp.]|nr:virulence RhuM family protein [Ferruginibacter sp.]